MSDVLKAPGQQIVSGHYLVAFAQQSIAQMRTEKARSTGHQHPSCAQLLQARSFLILLVPGASLCNAGGRPTL